jgi:hypothetical protein
MMPHKFAVGDHVHFRPAVLPIDMAVSLHLVTMLLPEIDGELAYRVRNPNEPHERGCAVRQSPYCTVFARGRPDGDVS